MILPLFLFGMTTAAYQPTAVDDALLLSLEPRVDALYKSDMNRTVTVTNKIKAILPSFDPNSRTYYILQWLSKYIDSLVSKDVQKISAYSSYDPANVTQALNDGKDVILFFHANWCPTCVAVDGNIQEDLEDLDSNLVIFKVDFDDSELADQYGVTKQHTMVTLASDGTVIERKQWVNTVSQLNKLF